MEPFNIRSRATECLSDFDALVAVQPSVDDRRNAVDLDGEEQKARFLIWSANIGVFADGHASLDYRLRDSLEARKLMLDLLESLKNYLRRATETIRPTWEDEVAFFSVPNSEGSLSSEGFQPASASSVLSSSYRGSDTDGSQSMSVDLDRTPFEQRLHGIEQTIDRLYRLSVAIRRPSILSQNAKAANFVIRDEEGNDVGEQFADFALKWITHQFPDASLGLRQRLASSVTLRRKRFLYRQSHQRKLSTKQHLAPPALAGRPSSPAPDAESTVIARTIVEIPTQAIQSDNQQRGFLKPILPSQTSASKISGKVRTEDVFQLTPSRTPTVFSGAFSQQASIAVPEPPKPCLGSKEFECPYCCMMLPIKDAIASQWTRHVLNDLEPYICIFENCKDAHRLFRDRASWLTHMRESHTRQWTCTAAGHKLRVFETEQEFEDHMRLDHARGFKESQLTWYKKRSQGPSVSLFTTCPLCAYEPSEDKITTLVAAKGIDYNQKYERVRLISEDVAKHLALHLQALSMKALPWQENVEEEAPSEKEASKHADEGHESNDDRSSLSLIDTNSSLQFDDVPLVIQAGDWETESYTVSDSDEFLQPQETYESEWGFIRRPEYFGHDRDPILQKLLRKLYLNSSSGADRSTGPELPLYMMPPTPPNKNFFGRDYALNAIEAELCPKTISKPVDGKAFTYPLTFAICAPGGMGKTQVAIQFAITHQQQFDAIFWVNADSINEMAHGFQKIAILLDLIPEGSADANDLLHTRETVKRWLVNPRARNSDGGRKARKITSWLLIYDGVQDPDILNDYWPYDGPGSVLITSRNPFSWARSLPLLPFTSDEAIAFLLMLTNRNISDIERESVTKVSARLGGLPLALTQMASIIVTKQLSFSQFLDSYNERESQRELLQLQTELKSLSYEHTVASVWAFENLKHGRELLNVMSMIDPDGIPERLFTTTLNNIDLPGYPTTIEKYQDAKRELLACSLVTVNKQEHKLFIHRLVQDVARARMGHVEFRQTLLACVKLISSIWPFENFAWRHGIARWPSCEELFPHISKLKDLFPAVLPSSETSDDYHFAKLLTDAGWYLHERGRPVESNLFNNMAQSICESLKFRLYETPNAFSDDSVTHAELDYVRAELYHNRGCIASDANDAVEAMNNLRSFHHMMEKEFGNNTHRTDMRLGLACNELGNAYMLKEDWVQGEKYFLQSIDLLEQLDKYEPVLISLPLVNLGYAYWLQGRLAEAMAVLEKGIHDREEKYGVHDRISFISGRFYHALGNVTYDQGSMEESFNYHHKALLHYKSTLGNNHHRTAAVFVKVAEHNIRVHQYDTAVVLLDHALKTYSMSSNYRPEKTRASFKRSRALRSLNLIDEANKEQRRCFRVYSELIVERAKLTGKQRTPKKRADDLIDQDFDDLVAFWYK
ncbi:hypothetical protein BP6252_11927 [Coleophoma cylindrospora]|uniref:NB-ARC domain-containing protein n=1 Tax=Coleophoma cylindrospora TaxID=1849047 RepID=A0A3D8QGK3_9HELO|nr:hypothetical protein BP6252_11927 [Coleophoma cylindrospora]